MEIYQVKHVKTIFLRLDDRVHTESLLLLPVVPFLEDVSFILNDLCGLGAWFSGGTHVACARPWDQSPAHQK
jgi:hypothetical protein